MFSPLPLLQTAWAFYRKQPVLNQVLLWLFFLPLLGMRILSALMEDNPLSAWPVVTPGPGISLLVGLASLLLGILLTWGMACVLLISKRLIKSPAGRSRTSFRAVRQQALPFVVPLILSNILRTVLTLLWSLLLIVPGIVFFLRSSLYSVAVVCEKKLYRSSFDRSKELMKGRVPQVILTLLLLGCCTFLPGALLSGIVAAIISLIDMRFLPIADAVDSACLAFSLLLFMLATVELYAKLLKGHKAEVDDD